jgi:hypothetical protein
MSSKPGRDRPRVSRSLPHSSWNLDRPIMMGADDAVAGEGERRTEARRRVTAEEIWAVVDAVN